MTFLTAAESVLLKAGKPMHVNDITVAGLSEGLIQTEGKTPEATMGARLAIAVKNRGESSRFVRTGPSTYGLREWLEAGRITAQSPRTDDGREVRVPHFPAYAKVRAALPLLNGVASKTVTMLITSIHSQMGNPQANRDWTDPSVWIPSYLEGDPEELAARLWRDSGQLVNPRYLRDIWALIRNYDLLDDSGDGQLALGPRGQSFLGEHEGAISREIDEKEGLLKILSLVAELGPARKSDLLEPWRDHLAEVSNLRSDSAASAALYRRLSNLRDRDYVVLEGRSYSITESGLKWLGEADIDDAGGEADAYQKIISLAHGHKAQIRDTIHDLLYEMDPYAFEKLIAQLLERMGYDDPEVTPRGNDKGVDVLASIVLGITSVNEVIQAKRVRGNIGRPVLDSLRGSLHRFDATRGTIITTGGFSTGAVNAANERGAAPITLIDGRKLVDLLIENGIGVRKKPIDVWELDPSALSGEDESDEGE